MRKRRFEARAIEAQAFVDVAETVSIAGLHINTGDGYKTYIGEAKRMPGDPWDANVAVRLALGRALADASRALLAEAGTEA